MMLLMTDDPAEARARLQRAARDIERGRQAADAAEEAICELKRAGWTTEAIAAIAPYGISHVNRILKRNGLTTPRAGS